MDSDTDKTSNTASARLIGRTSRWCPRYLALLAATAKTTLHEGHNNASQQHGLRTHRYRDGASVAGRACRRRKAGVGSDIRQ